MSRSTARASTASAITAVDPSAEARENALRLGATEAYTPEEFERRVRGNPEQGPRRVLHLTSAKGSMGLAVRAVARLGVIAAVGTPDEDPVIIPEYYQMMIVKEATIVGCYSKSVDYWDKTIRLVEDGAIAVPDDTHTVEFGPQAAAHALQLADRWPVRGRQYIRFA